MVHVIQMLQMTVCKIVLVYGVEMLTMTNVGFVQVTIVRVLIARAHQMVMRMRICAVHVIQIVLMTACKIVLVSGVVLL